MILLHEYLRAYIPYNINGSDGVNNGSAVVDYSSLLLKGDAAAAMAMQQVPSLTDYASIYKRNQELFLRLVIEYWIDTTIIVHTDHHKLGIFKRIHLGMDLNQIDRKGM